MWDGLISMVLGLGVGTLSELAAETRALNLVIEFVAALMVAIVARVCSVYLPTFKLCFFAICISSLVWLLPGASNVATSCQQHMGQNLFILSENRSR